MPVKIDELFWDLSVKDDKLEQDLRRIQSRMKRLGKEVASQLTKDFADFDPARNVFRRKGAKGFTSPKDEGKKIGQDILKGLEETFGTRAARSREALFRGLIKRKEFERQGIIAAREFNQALLQTIKSLRGTGALTAGLERQLVGALKDTGQTGGRAFGQSFQSTVLQSFFKIQRILRLTFAGGIVSLITLLTRRIVALFRTAGRQIDKILTEAGNLERIRNAFQFLSTSVGISPGSLLIKAREASAGLVNDLTLIRQLNFALQAGLPATEDQLARLVFVARRLGESVGRDATEAFERLTNAIVKQERRVLDELGIVVRFQKAHKEWAEQMGITNRRLTTQETILANLETVTAKAEEAVRRLGSETDDVGKKYRRIRVDIENARLAFVDMIGTSVPVISLLNRIGVATNAFADTMEQRFVDIGVQIDLFVIKLENAVIRAKNVFKLLNLPFTLDIERDALQQLREGRGPTIGPLGVGATAAAAARFSRLGFQATIDVDEAKRIAEDARRFRLEQRQLQELIRAENDLSKQRQFRHDIDLEIFKLSQQEAKNAFEAAAIEEKRNALRESYNASIVRSNIIRAQAAPGEEGTGDPLSEAEQRKIDQARERLRQLNAEIRVLQSFGATTLAGIAAAPLRAIAQEIIAIDQETASIEQLLKDARISSDEANARIDELKSRRADLLRQKIRLENTPEALLSEAAKNAKKEIEELAKTRALLSAFGVEFLADIPQQGTQAAAELDKVNARIEAFQQDLKNLGEGETTVAGQIVAAIFQLSRQRQELEQNADAVAAVGTVLASFPDISARFLGALDPDTLQFLKVVLEGANDAAQRLARAEHDLAVARTTADSEKIATAEERVAAARENQRRVVAALIANLQFTNLTQEQRLVIEQALLSTLEQQDETQESLSKKLRGLRAAVRGIIQLADAFGVLNEQTRKALQGVENVLSGVIELSKGNLIGGIVQVAGGFANLISGLFGGGPSPEEIRISEEAAETADALRELKNSADAVAAAFNQITGDQFQGLLAAFDQVQREIREAFDPSDLDPGEVFDQQVIDLFTVQAVKDALKDFGITISDLEQISEATGIDVSALIELLKDGSVNVQELNQEFVALNSAIKTIQEDAFKSFGTQLDLLRTKFDLFDESFEKPIDRLAALIDVLSDPALDFLPEDIREQLKSFDISTPEGRAGLESFVQELFNQLLAGDFGVLGRLTFAQFKDALGEVEGLLDEIAEDVEQQADSGETESAIIRKSITEVTGNRMVGVLTTIAIINQGILAIVKEILLEMGGTLPTDLQAITFRAPATQLDILEIEQQQLDRLVEIRDLIAGGAISTTGAVPVSNADIPFVPVTQPVPATPGLAPSVTINNPSFTAEISTTGPLTEEDARLFAQRGSDFLVGEIDLALGRKTVRGTTSSSR